MADRRGNSVERYYASKQKRRKSRRAKLYAFLILFCIATFVILSLTVFFNIRSFSVQGNTTYSKAQIIASTGLAEGDNLFRLNKFKIAEAMQEKLPYICAVEIYRKLPTTLCIDVQESGAAMVAYHGGKYVLLSSKLKVLEFKEELPEGVCYLIGVKFGELAVGKPAVFEKATTEQMLGTLLSEVQEHLDFSKVSALDLTESYNLRLYYDNHRIKVLLGASEKLDDKLQMASTTIRQNGVSEYARIDITTATSAYYRVLEEEEIDDLGQMLIGKATAKKDKTFDKVDETEAENDTPTEE